MGGYGLDPIGGNRDAGRQLDVLGMLGRQRHRDVDVAVEHLRVIEPALREAMVLGDDEVFPGVGFGWVGDCEFHRRKVSLLRETVIAAGDAKSQAFGRNS